MLCIARQAAAPSHTAPALIQAGGNATRASTLCGECCLRRLCELLHAPIPRPAHTPQNGPPSGRTGHAAATKEREREREGQGRAHTEDAVRWSLYASRCTRQVQPGPGQHIHERVRRAGSGGRGRSIPAAHAAATPPCVPQTARVVVRAAWCRGARHHVYRAREPRTRSSRRLHRVPTLCPARTHRCPVVKENGVYKLTYEWKDM